MNVSEDQNEHKFFSSCINCAIFSIKKTSIEAVIIH